MVAVMIGIDPHMASHTAVVIDPAEVPPGQSQVRACAAQAERLLAWAQAWPQRTWAVEGAGGVGHLLAQQLVTAGERVLDVPPKLAARVRLLATGNTSKNDPHDARSVAVAALRSAGVCEVCRDDHAAVLKVWSKRYKDLGRARTQAACRLHQVLCELIPGGVSKEITAGLAARILASFAPADAVAAARCELAAELTEDLRGIDVRLRGTRKKLAAAVRTAGTSLTGLFGIGPVSAAAIIGDVRHVSRFPGRDQFASYNGTAPIEVSSGGRKACRLSRRGNRRLNHAIHMAAVTQIRYRHSPGRAYYDKKLAEGKTGKEALRCLKRQISDAIFACLQPDARRAAATPAKSPGGQPGNHAASRAAGSHPDHRLFGQATPGPGTHPTTPAADPAPGSFPPRCHPARAGNARGGQEHLTWLQRGVRSVCRLPVHRARREPSPAPWAVSRGRNPATSSAPVPVGQPPGGSRRARVWGRLATPARPRPS
jgi:transposase